MFAARNSSNALPSADFSLNCQDAAAKPAIAASSLPGEKVPWVWNGLRCYADKQLSPKRKLGIR